MQGSSMKSLPGLSKISASLRMKSGRGGLAILGIVSEGSYSASDRVTTNDGSAKSSL